MGPPPDRQRPVEYVVHAVRVGYLILIPFMIGGLLLQVTLHVWHVVRTR